MIDYKGIDKLHFWQRKLSENESAWKARKEEFDERERIYKGLRDIDEIIEGDSVKKTAHVRNLVSEMIETQINSVIPQPKVTPLHKKDEDKAKLIEDMIRNELDRLPMEQLNDMAERMVPIQGGCIWLVEWDDSESANRMRGDVAVTLLHPKQIVPQDGVYSSIDDMDYIFLKLPATKSYIEDRYGVDVDNEGESEPDVKAVDEHAVSDDLVTQYVVYYRGKGGVIGRYSWVNDIELEDFDDYQQRTVRKCAECGYVPKDDSKRCPQCGGRIKESTEEFEEIYEPIVKRDGSIIEGEHLAVDTDVLNGDADGEPYMVEPTRVAYYKPQRYPLVLHKNISVFGQLLGESDVDKIADQQNTMNRLSQKLIDRIVKAGSKITLPEETHIDIDSVDSDVWRINDPAQKNLIGVYSFDGNLQYEMAYYGAVYEEARQIIGITDSFQGRNDSTATSRVAKEFAAQQSAGRMESKRTMKKAAWSVIFESIFKLKLAYADEPRPVISKDANGNPAYDEFNRYDFIERYEETGEYYYNDQFIFSCDTDAPLTNDRTALWQETRMNLESGAFGNPQDINTLLLFWRTMNEQHYPIAAQVVAYLEEQQQQQMQAQSMQQAQMEAQAAMMPQMAQQMPPQNWGEVEAATNDALAQIKGK